MPSRYLSRVSLYILHGSGEHQALEANNPTKRNPRMGLGLGLGLYTVG